MTAIIGFKDTYNIYLAGDNAAVSVSHHSAIPLAPSKVFRNGSFLMGYTSSFRMGQLLEHEFQPPQPPHGICTVKFMITEFVDALRERTKAAGFAKKDKEEESGGTFIVGYVSRKHLYSPLSLYLIQDDYAVIEPSNYFITCGSGSEILNGSLYSTKDEPILTRLYVALEAAQRFNICVRSPFTYIASNMDEPRLLTKPDEE